MAPRMREAFRILLRGHAPDADEAAPERWLDGLIADGRHVEDVYATG
ncbi:hypothetical protein QNO09_02880 [Streptomyces sp. 378]|nr:hypothetical protein [Streptomyces sp. 378]MDK1342275.1 hypothetical protein [Streptomyces sp. 378]